MRAVVTGASGHLGGVLVRALLARGHDVCALDLVDGPALEGLDVEFRRADVTDPESFGGAFDGADVVYHLAAKISVAGDPDGSVWRVNTDGPKVVALATLAAGVPRLVHTSSVHAYDLELVSGTLTEEGPRTTDPARPVYDRSKYAGEQAVRSVIDLGLDAVIVNPTGVIGPFDFAPSRMGQVFLGMLQRTVPFSIPGGFDWVDVRDVADGMIAAAAEGTTGQNYLLSGTHLDVRAVMELAADTTGRPAPRAVLPMWMAKAWSPLGDRLARRTGSAWALTSESIHALEFDPPVSGAKASAELGYLARPIETTIRDIYGWFDEAGRS